MSTIPATERTTLKRLPERGEFDRDTINAILDEGILCHLAIVHNGSPVVIPTLYGRDSDELIIHGSPASRAMRTARGGIEVCVNITLIDGIVVARSGFHSSMNYRSVTIFGRAVEVTELEEKMRLLSTVIDHVIPDRTSTARAMTKKEVQATMVLRLPIQEVSAKVRTGWPHDEPEDYDEPVWAGVIPVYTTFGTPLADPDLRVSVDVPD
ncbi:MAG: pyridoxamine 5'-phosphate oxidase family protein, partial [Acidimicrobiia bacterium]|nr:pyridoxamine 5'-phosphate oxidase family protein [Acidimicrobiia bacterium]